MPLAAQFPQYTLLPTNHNLGKSSIFYPLSSGGAIFLDSPFPNMHPQSSVQIMRAAAICLNQNFQD
jgi:hypothetical protein